MSEWPFDDPPETASMTVKPALEQGEPILYVHRDEEDGMFQFLTGGEFGVEDGVLVSLECMLVHDDSLRGVADLPPGGSAERDDVSSPWSWTLPGQEDLDLGELIEPGPDAWDEERYEAWLTEAIEALRAKQATLEDLYGFGSYPHFEYDLDQGTFTFSGDERDPLVASVQVVGSTSALTGTWLWGWDNPYVPETAHARTEEARAFGQQHGLRELTTPKWTGDEGDGWAMTAAAAHLLDATGAYRAPDEKGALFLLLFDVRLGETRGEDPPQA